MRVGRDDGFSFEQLDEGEVCALEYRGKGGFLRARAVVVATRATGNTVYLSIEPWKHLDLVLSNDIGGDVVWAFVHRPCAPEKAVGPELRVQRAVAIGPRALRVDRLRQDVVSGKLWTAGGFYARLWNVVVSRTDAATETPVRFEKPGQLVVRARTLPEGPLRVHVADASYETKQRRLRRPRRLRGLAEAAIRTRTGALTRDGSCTFNHMWAISYDVFVIDDAGLVLDHKTCRVAPATTTTCYVLESGGRGRLILKARAPVKFRVVSASQGTVAAGVIEAGKVRDLGWLPRDRYQAWWGGARPGRIEFELGQDRRTEIVLPGR